MSVDSCGFTPLAPCRAPAAAAARDSEGRAAGKAANRPYLTRFRANIEPMQGKYGGKPTPRGGRGSWRGRIVRDIEWTLFYDRL